MKRHAFLFLALLAALPAAAQPGTTPLPALDAARRAAIVDSVTAALDTVYVFPEVATAMVADVRSRLAAGEYDAIMRPEEFAQRLTTDLRAICHDRHLAVQAELPPPPGEREDPTVARRLGHERARRTNFGFAKLEHLDGNVGYLKLDGFSGDPEAGLTAVAAMNFLAYSDAIIIDLTENGGGSPAMIQLLTTYLLDEPTHLNSFSIRATGDSQQFWTLPWVPGPRLAHTPVYVLTSSRTFSAAEEFTYNLKNLGRATIVGETTGGGAHPVQSHQFDFGAYLVTMSLPFGRAVNPITGTNWEGTGIEPHLVCPADQALDTAYSAGADVPGRVQRGSRAPPRTGLGPRRPRLAPGSREPVSGKARDLHRPLRRAPGAARRRPPGLPARREPADDHDRDGPGLLPARRDRLFPDPLRAGRQRAGGPPRRAVCRRTHGHQRAESVTTF